MKPVFQGTSVLFLLLCLLFAQCSKTPDTPVTPKSSVKTLTSPTIDGVPGASSTFDAATSTYTVTVPSGTDVTALKVSFNLPTGATSKPTVGSAQNFTSPVVYTVTAEDGTTQPYTVKVVVTAAPKSSEKQITAFTFAALSPVVSATIDQTTRKITAVIPASADLTSLVPIITLSAKSTVSPASGMAQDFTNPVSYTVTAEDGSKQNYEVKVDKTVVVVSNVPCLLTRIEDASDANEYITFEYTQDGKVSKMNATPKFGYPVSFEYNQNGEVTKWILPQGYSTELIYTNGKLSSFKRYINGVLQPVPGRTDGEYIGDFIVVNSNNEVVRFVADRYEYLNGNLSRLDTYNNADTKIRGARFEYDTKKHFLSASKSKGIFGALFHYSWEGIDYGGIVGILPTFLNNPVKKIFDDGNELRFNYTYNSNGLPVELNLTSTVPGIKVDLKYTYSNCQ